MIELTDKEKNIMCQIACDMESGHHLLFKRSQEWQNMANEISLAFEHEKHNEQSDREKALLSFYRSCFYEDEN